MSEPRLPHQADTGKVDLPQSRTAASVADSIRWAEAHLHARFSVAWLAEQALVSRSTYGRYFRQQTGSAPLDWLVTKRLDRAKHLLETTDQQIQEVANLCGFELATMRHHWRHRVGGSPSAWRAARRQAQRTTGAES